MAYVQRPNRKCDDTGETWYEPYVMDSSVVDALRHRGVPEERISAVLVDLDHFSSLADQELIALLPATATMGATIHQGSVIRFRAELGDGVLWNGTDLRVRRSIPETLMQAMPGRMLREIVDHPVLPDRAILSATTFGETLILTVAPDLRPVLELSRASGAILKDSAARCARRRALFDSCPNADWEEAWTHNLQALTRREGKRYRDRREIEPWCWGSAPEIRRTPPSVPPTRATPAPFLKRILRSIAGRVTA